MKIPYVPIKSLPLIIATFFCLCWFSSCSTRMKFATSTVVPAAQGSVKVGKDDNGNYDIELNILHLTDPSRLQPAKKIYVIWMETASNGTKNIGQLKSSTGFFTSTLKAYFHTVTPFKPERFFITAENDPSVKTPGSQTVLITR
jgi:hypothetical protein